MKKIIISLLFIQLFSSNSYSMQENAYYEYEIIDSDDEEEEITIDKQPGNASSPKWVKYNDEPGDEAYNKFNYHCLRFWDLLLCTRCCNS